MAQDKSFLNIPFLTAAEKGDIEAIQGLLQAGANPNAFHPENGNTALHFAAINGSVEIAKILLDRNANIEAKSNDGKTPIFFAISNKKKDMLQFLLSKNANIEAKDNSNYTPLEEAVRSDYKEATLLLLDSGANALQVKPNLAAHDETISNWQKERVINTAKFINFYKRLTPVKYKEKQIFQGHTSHIYCLEVLPDGRLVSGCADGTIKIWDLTNGQCVQTLKAHIYNVFGLHYLPDGKIVSSSGLPYHGKGTIQVWDLKSGQCIQTIQEANAYPYHKPQCLPGGRVVSYSSNNMIKVWDLNSGKCLQILQWNTGTNSCIQLLPNERFISSSDDNTIQVWDLKSGQCVKTLQGHTNAISCIQLLLNERLVSSSHDSTIKLWDLKNGQCIQTLHGHTGPVYNFQLLPDGRLFSNSYDKTIKLWDLTSGMCLQTLQAHTDNLQSVGCASMKLLADGSILSVSCGKYNATNTIKLWKPENFKLDFDAVEIDELRENVSACKMQ